MTAHHPQSSMGERVKRTTSKTDDRLLGLAQQLTGIREKIALVKLRLKALVARESAKRLAALRGNESS